MVVIQHHVLFMACQNTAALCHVYCARSNTHATTTMPAKDKPYNSGQWTEARRRSFIMSALRRAAWPVKYECIRNAYECSQKNPKTGRMNKMYKCAECGELFPQKSMAADHINPVVPITGFDSWGAVIDRLYCEIDGLQALCKECHSVKTKQENKERKSCKNSSR